MTALKKYTDLRAWWRHLWRSSVNAGCGALIAGAGTHTAEALPLKITEGVGLDFRQLGAVFLAAAFWSAIRKIQAATADNYEGI